MSISMKKKSVTSLSRQTLDATADRALAFLRASAADTRIAAALGDAGFTDKDSERGWSLVRNVFTAPTPGGFAEPSPAASAMEEIEAWNGPGFLRARAALRHLHPEQEAFVFEGLAAAHGAEAVLQVATFLDRCAELESGKSRKGSHKADHAALATLETRGVTKAERTRLHHLVDIVQKQAAPVPDTVAAPPTDRDARIMELRAWLLDWTDTARAVIKRRDQLIRLGIGKRRAKKGAGPVPAPLPVPAPVATPPVVVTPVVVTPPVAPPHAAAPVIAAAAIDDDEPAPNSSGPSGSPLRRVA